MSWLDNLLDSAAAPAAVVAGTVASAAVITCIEDLLGKWAIALITGGGAAGMVQVLTVAARAASIAEL